jgi:hypothetical protein
MPADPRPRPPRLTADHITRLVEAYQRHGWRLPMLHADDVVPMLDGSDREIAAASALIEDNRVFYPQ